MTSSIAAFNPSGFLPPAVAKKACPPPPPWMCLDTSLMIDPALKSLLATMSSDAIILSVHFPSATPPRTPTKLSTSPFNWNRMSLISATTLNVQEAWLGYLASGRYHYYVSWHIRLSKM